MATETLVTTSNILDAEFNHRDGLGAFITASGGKLWVFTITQATGLIVPSDGQTGSTPVDTLCAYAGDFGNGVEWSFGGSQDAQLIYTKYGGTPDPTTARNARAIKVGGRWCPAFLDTELPACIQIASPTGKPSTGGDLTPRIHWNPPSGVGASGAYWRPLDSPGFVQRIPGSEGYIIGQSRRNIDGNHKIIWVNTPAQGGNAFTYDTDTGVTEQLTTLAAGQYIDDAFMWPAPEYGGEYVFFATVNTGSAHSLRVYRKVAGTWTVINTITAPSGSGTGPYIWSPEPFTSTTNSYIFAMLSANTSSQAAVNVGIGVGLALSASTLTTISDGTANNRRDPEYYPYGPGGTYKIWYNRYDVGTGTSQGVYFADTSITIV